MRGQGGRFRFCSVLLLLLLLLRNHRSLPQPQLRCRSPTLQRALASATFSSTCENRCTKHRLVRE
jgi:hypothetical protein